MMVPSSTSYRNESSSDSYEYMDYSPARNCVGRNCSKMHILMFPVMATHLAAMVALGYLTEAFAYPLTEKNPGKPEVRFYAMVAVDSVILLVSIVAESVHCHLRKKNNVCPRIIPPPPILATAGVLGSWLASLVEHEKAINIYDNYETQYTNWQTQYLQLYEDCLDEVSNKSVLFTSKECTSCFMGGIVGNFEFDQMIQAVIQQGVNITLCDIPGSFDIIEANKTVFDQTWPCGGVVTSEETTTFEAPFIELIGSQYNLNPPMSLRVLRKDEKCGRLEGYATNLFNVSALCGQSTDAIYDLDNPCATTFMTEFFTLYRNSYAEIADQEPIRPGSAIVVMNSSLSTDLLFPLGGLFLFSIIYFVFDRHLKRRHAESRPLLLN